MKKSKRCSGPHRPNNILSVALFLYVFYQISVPKTMKEIRSQCSFTFDPHQPDHWNDNDKQNWNVESVFLHDEKYWYLHPVSWEIQWQMIGIRLSTCPALVPFYSLSLITSRVSGRGHRIRAVFLCVCLCVCVCVCEHSHGWTVWPMTLIFCMIVDLDLS